MLILSLHYHLRSASPPLEQSAWAWVDTIQDPETEVGRPEILSAYKLNFPAHIFHEAKCKKNCKSNPRCYIGNSSYLIDTLASFHITIIYIFDSFKFSVVS